MEEIDLYQKTPNSIWFTEKPIFDSLTKKQIESGIEVKSIDEKYNGLFSFENFVSISNKLYTSGQYIYIRKIESLAPFSKKEKIKERQKLSLKLRYETLKFNKFKCVSCGVNASDSELQIDHIIPISKGGKTEKSNLQTLCNKCNLGKSNII